MSKHREMMSMWYRTNRTVTVWFSPTAECVIPAHLRDQADIQFAIGRTLRLPVLDLLCSHYGFSCTLSFASVDLFEVMIPWSCVRAIHCGTESIRVIEKQPHQSQTFEIPKQPRARAMGLRVITGGKSHDTQRAPTTKDPA